MKQPSEYLFRDKLKTFAVLDGASVPDLPVKLYEMNQPNVCLYRGELPPDIIHVAPYLVQLLPEMPFTDWLLTEGWGKHWGIFAQSRLPLIAMRKHLRTLLTVYDESGKPLLFRYYDPRVFLAYLPTCNAQELEIFFGNINYYFAESEDATQLHRYHFSKNELKETNINLKLEN